MQESVSMHKNPTLFRHSHMNQARSEEEQKETGKTEARRLMERKAAQQNLPDELKLERSSAQIILKKCS